MSHDGRRRAILAIDTATTQVVVASGSPDGVIDGLTTWAAGYRHGETLLPDDRAVPRRAEHAALAPGRDRGRDRARAPSPGCASGSPPPRASPTGWVCRSRGSRPRRRCWPRRAGAAEDASEDRRSGPRRPPSCCSRPVRTTGSWSGRAGAPGCCPAARIRSWRPASGWWPSTSTAAPRTTPSSAASGPAGALGGADPDGRGAAPRRGRRRPRRARARSTSRCRAAWPRRAGRWHGRATPAEAAHRADAGRGPAGRPRHRAGELRFALAGRRLPQRARDEPAGPVPRRSAPRTTIVAYGGMWLMVDEAHIITFAVHPIWRRQRIGERLLLALLDLAHGRRRARGDARGPAVEPRRPPAVREVRLPAGRPPAALLQRQRRGRPDHDDRPAARPARCASGSPGCARRSTPRRRRSIPRADAGMRRPTLSGTAAGPLVLVDRIVVRRDRHRRHRGRPADPLERGRLAGRAPRAVGRDRPRGRGPRPPALDRAGPRRGLGRRRGRAGRDIDAVAVTYGPGLAGLAAGRDQLRQGARLGPRRAAGRRQPPRGPRLRGLAARSGRTTSATIRSSRWSRWSCPAGTPSWSRCATT